MLWLKPFSSPLQGEGAYPCDLFGKHTLVKVKFYTIIKQSSKFFSYPNNLDNFHY